MEAQESKQKSDQLRIVAQKENPLVVLIESKLRRFCKLTKKEQQVQLSEFAKEFYETCAAPFISQIVLRDAGMQRLVNLLNRVVVHLRSWADHRRKGWSEALRLIKEVQKTVSSWERKKKDEKLKQSVSKKTGEQNKGQDSVAGSDINRRAKVVENLS